MEKGIVLNKVFNFYIRNNIIKTKYFGINWICKQVYESRIKSAGKHAFTDGS